MEYPKRKHPRLKGYDYSQNGAYFITICTKDRKTVLGHIPPGREYTSLDEQELGQAQVTLSAIGAVCREYIENINSIYPALSVDQYMIMPNHIHLLLSIKDPADGGMWASRPTVSSVVRSFKTMVTKKTGTSVWQTSFYEHVIRNQQDYDETWTYILENPAKWELDELYGR